MSRTFYVVMRHDLDGCGEYVAVTPLLNSEEKARKELLKEIKSDLTSQYADKKGILKRAEDFLDDNDFVDLTDEGFDYVYKIMEIDVLDGDEIEPAFWYKRYQNWLNEFKKTLKIPKVGSFYPREFCLGILSNINHENPAWCLEQIGFYDHVLPIDWEQFFTTGHVKFKDHDSSNIVFDFKLHTDEKGWSADISVKVDDKFGVYEYEFDLDEDLSKAAKLKSVSFTMGQLFMMMLLSTHPQYEGIDNMQCEKIYYQ